MEWSNEEVGDFLLHYDVGGLQAVERLVEGEDNLNLRLSTARGDYVLRQYRQRQAVEVLFEIEFIGHLVEADFPTPSLMRDKTGEVLARFGGKPAALFGFVEGFRIDEPADHCRQVGRLLAQLHRTSAAFVPSEFRMDGRWGDIERLLQFETDTVTDLAQMKRVASDYMKVIQPHLIASKKALPQGAIHYDLNPTNVLADADGNLSWVLDFDSSCVDTLVLDIVVLFQYWANVPSRFELDPERVQKILQGYQEVRTLEPAEIDSLAYNVLYMYMSEAAGYVLGRAQGGKPFAAEECHTYGYYRRLRQLFDEGGLGFLTV
jgi:homoserine kinase type II